MHRLLPPHAPLLRVEAAGRGLRQELPADKKSRANFRRCERNLAHAGAAGIMKPAGPTKVSEGPCGARKSLEASEHRPHRPCRRSRHHGLAGPTKVSEGPCGASYSPETRGHRPLGHAPAVEGEDGVPQGPAASSGAAADRPPQHISVLRRPSSLRRGARRPRCRPNFRARPFRFPAN